MAGFPQSNIDWSKYMEGLQGKVNIDFTNTPEKLPDVFLNKFTPDYTAGVDKGLEFVADRNYYLRVQVTTKRDQYTGGTNVFIYVNDIPIKISIWWSANAAGAEIMEAWICKGDRVKIAPKVNDGWIIFESKTCYPLKGAN